MSTAWPRIDPARLPLVSPVSLPRTTGTVAAGRPLRVHLPFAYGLTPARRDAVHPVADRRVPRPRGGLADWRRGSPALVGRVSDPPRVHSRRVHATRLPALRHSRRGPVRRHRRRGNRPRPARFATFAELYPYCYRVASAVGLACVRIWGLRPGATCERRRAAGRGRGHRVPAHEHPPRPGRGPAPRGRVYLPADELGSSAARRSVWAADTGVPRTDAVPGRAAPASYYRRRRAARCGCSRPTGGRSSRVMSGTYRGLLDEIEAAAGTTCSRGGCGCRRGGEGSRCVAGWRMGRGRADTIGPQRDRVIGGGLAGLAAAVALAPRGFRVTVLESRQRLGGRAGSFTDPTPASWSTPASTSAWAAAPTSPTSAAPSASATCSPRSRSCTSSTPDRRVERLQGRPVARPVAPGRALLAAHYLTPGDKLRVACGLARAAARAARRRPAAARLAATRTARRRDHRPLLGRGAGRAR